MNNFKRKKKGKQKERDLTKRFSYDLMSLKPPGEEKQKFLSELTSFLFWRMHAEKNPLKFFWVRGQKEVALVCVGVLVITKKQGLLLKFPEIKTLRGKTQKTAGKPTNENKFYFTGNINTCLKVSTN